MKQSVLSIEKLTKDVGVKVSFCIYPVEALPMNDYCEDAIRIFCYVFILLLSFRCKISLQKCLIFFTTISYLRVYQDPVILSNDMYLVCSLMSITVIFLIKECIQFFLSMERRLGYFP